MSSVRMCAKLIQLCPTVCTVWTIACHAFLQGINTTLKLQDYKFQGRISSKQKLQSQSVNTQSHNNMIDHMCYRSHNAV